MDIETVIGRFGRFREARLGRRRMTTGPGGCERPGGDAGRGRQVTMRDGISALSSVRHPPSNWTAEAVADVAIPAALERAICSVAGGCGAYEAIRGSRRIANKYARPVILWSISVRLPSGPSAQISLAPSIDNHGRARFTLIRSPSTT